MLCTSVAASRNYLELEKKYKRLELQNTVIQGELSDKNYQLHTLRTASQNMYKEYETLKNTYDLETGALHRQAYTLQSEYNKITVQKNICHIIVTDLPI